MKKIILVVCVFLFAAVVAKAVDATAGATGKARAKIVAPVTLSHDTGDALNFGIIVSPTADATVTVAPAATNPSVTDSPATLQHVSGESISADKFTVGGLEGGMTYDITLPSVAITLTSGSNAMTVDTFTTNLDPVTGQTATEFYVGGTLHVGSGQVAGDYSGEYTVSITY